MNLSKYTKYGDIKVQIRTYYSWYSGQSAYEDVQVKGLNLIDIDEEDADDFANKYANLISTLTDNPVYYVHRKKKEDYILNEYRNLVS